jgi:hypothetical protein
VAAVLVAEVTSAQAARRSEKRCCEGSRRRATVKI